ncbi:MAG: C39 family peptidase [Planctomycetes bacterium]|nr:C39 family peptidase [Planctomycetota bacterium]
MLLLALGGAAALSACRTTTPVEGALSAHAVVLDLPLVRQDELHACGLASITALCAYWGVVLLPEERAQLAATAASERGLSGGELRSALVRSGLDAFLFSGSLDRTETGLYGHIDAGRPPLVMLSPDGEAHHYSLVLGYDEPLANVILLDPLRGEVLLPVTVFERNWARCERFTLLAAPRSTELNVASSVAAGRDQVR